MAAETKPKITDQPIVELSPKDGHIPEFLNGDFYYFANFIKNQREVFDCILETTKWGQGTVKVYGKEHDEPRLTCLFSTQPGRTYSYSGRTTESVAFPKTIELLREAVSKVAGTDLDTCLVNLYRNGNDKIGMHSDKEVDLVPNAPIASISLGAVRHFDIWCKVTAPQQHPRYRIDLANGSLMIMGDNSQLHYLHGVPEQKKVKEPRINLTFRQTKD